MGTNAVIFTSLDGATWSKIDLANDSNFNDLLALDAVIYTGTCWLGFARRIGACVLIRSTDMVTLTRLDFPELQQVTSVAVGNNLVVATGFFNDAVSDDDGLTWSEGSYTNPNYFSPYVAFGNGIFILAQTISHNIGPVFIQETTDGLNFTDLTQINDIGMLIGLRFFNGRFYLIATDADNANNVLFTSSDGVTWTKHIVSVANGIYMADICFGNGMYLLIPQNDGNACFISPNGNTWTEGATMPLSSAFYIRMVFAHGVFVAVTNNNNGFLVTTTDGQSWTSINPPEAGGVDFEDVAAHG